MTGTSGDGISVTNSAHITLSGNHVTYCGPPGQRADESGDPLNNTRTRCVVETTPSTTTSYAGIELMSGSTQNRGRGKQSDFQQRARVPAGGPRDPPARPLPETISTAMSAIDNEDSGIEAHSGSNSNLIYNNVTYDNGDHGIDI